MPFKKKLLTDPLPTRYPDVDIIFHGQILLRSDGVTCQAALNPLATDHVLSIEVRTKLPAQSDIIRMRHIWPLNYRQPEGMTINLNPVADPVAAWKCVMEEPIDYVGGTGNPTDFRWILNLEGQAFHGTNLTPDIFDSQHVITLKGGEYYFRTGARSSTHLNFKRSGGGKGDFTFKRIGAVARASLYLVQDQSVYLKWIHDGAERTLTLTKSMPDERHEIYIENTPLYDYTANDLEKHEELKEFYKMIPTIPDGERFTLKAFDPTAPTPNDGELGTPSIPCQVMRLDHPDGD